MGSCREEYSRKAYICDSACLQQGWGNFINTAVLILLMLIFHQNHPPYSRSGLGAVWRVSFGIGLIPVTGMLLYRLFGLKESKVCLSSLSSARKLRASCRGMYICFVTASES